MKKKKKIGGYFFPLVMVFLIIGFLGVCKSEKQMEEQTEETLISKDMLIPIFGRGEAQNSGLLDVNQDPDRLNISYYFFVEDLGSFDAEIEGELAPKIQELYKTIPEIDQVAFTVYIPQMGDAPYKPYVSFTVDRELVDKTNWDDLMELDFFRVVKDVRYFE